MKHSLSLVHRRRPLDVSTFDDDRYAMSTVEVSADSDNLVECFRELLSRLPNDVYAAVKQAIEEVP